MQTNVVSSSSLVSRQKHNAESSTTTRRTSVRKMHRQIENSHDTGGVREVKRHYSETWCGSDRHNPTDLIKEDYFESGSYRPDRIGKPWRSPNLSRRGIHSLYTDAESVQMDYSTTATITKSVKSSNNKSNVDTSYSATPTGSVSMRTMCLHNGRTGKQCSHKTCFEAYLELQRRQTKSDTRFDQTYFQELNSNVNNSFQDDSYQKSMSSQPSLVKRVSLWRAVSDNQTSHNQNSEAYLDQENSNAVKRLSKGRGKEKSRVSSIFGLDDVTDESSVRVTRSRARQLESERQSNQTTDVASTSKQSTGANSRNLQSVSWFTKMSYYPSHCVSGVRYQFHRFKESCCHVYNRCRPANLLLLPFTFVLIILRYLRHVPCFLSYLIAIASAKLFRRTSSSAEDNKVLYNQKTRRRRSVLGVCCSCCLILLLLFLLLIPLPFLLLHSGDNATETSGGRASESHSIIWLEKVQNVTSTIFKPITNAGHLIYASAYQVLCSVIEFFGSIFRFIASFLKRTVENILYYVRLERDSELGGPIWKEEEKITIISTGNGSSKDPRVDALIVKLQEHNDRLRAQEKDLKLQRDQLEKLMGSISDSKKSSDELKIIINKYESDLTIIQDRTAKLDSTLKDLESWKSKLSQSEGEQTLGSSFWGSKKKEEMATAKDLRAVQTLVEQLEALVKKEGQDTKEKLIRHQTSLNLLTSSKDKTGTVSASDDRNVRRLTEDVTSWTGRLASLEAQQQSLQKVLEALKKDQTTLQDHQRESKEEQSTLVQQQQALKGEQTTLLQQQEAIKKEQTTLQQHLQALKEEQTTLQQHQRGSKEEQATLLQQQDAISKEQATFQQNHKSSMLEMAALLKQQDAIKKEQATMQEQQQASKQEQATLLLQQEAIKKEQASLLQHQQASKEEQATLLQQQQAIKKEQTTLQEQQGAIKMEHATLQQQQQGLKVEHATLHRQQQEQSEQYKQQQQQYLLLQQNIQKTTVRHVQHQAVDESGKEVLVSGSSGITIEKIRILINQALEIFSADRLARPDFALESAGGSIIGTRCTQTYTDRPAVFSLFGVPLFRLSRSPRSVIQPAVQPGECWAFRGSKGQVVVRLSNPIAVSAITLEHIPASLSPNGRIESAPREFEVKGLESETDYEGWLLGRFEYLDTEPSLQTFEIVPLTEADMSTQKRKGNRPASFRYIELQVLSNHGHPEYTCVYRLRVHGKLLDASTGND